VNQKTQQKYNTTHTNKQTRNIMKTILASRAVEIPDGGEFCQKDEEEEEEDQCCLYTTH
jgi:hypothetical protein